jgi:hypothetical protein
MDLLEEAESKRIKYNEYMRSYLKDYRRANHDKLQASAVERNRKYRETHRELRREQDRQRYQQKKLLKLTCCC